MSLPKTGYGEKWQKQQDKPRNGKSVTVMLKTGEVLKARWFEGDPVEVGSDGRRWTNEETRQKINWQDIHGWQ